MVKIAVQPGVPRPMEGSKFPMLDGWSSVVFRGEAPEALVTVSLFTGRHRDGRYIPFHYPWRDLRIVFPCCHLADVENGVGRGIDQ